MAVLILVLAGAMVGFAVISAIREIQLYRMALKGDEQYLVSRRRRNRRLLISLLLVTEASFLVIGIFFFAADKPHYELLFWTPPLLLIVLLVHLSLQDLHETSRDIDRIFKEAKNSVLKVVDKNKKA